MARKYKIDERLKELKLEEYEFILKNTRQILGIASRQFHNWRTAPPESSLELTHKQVKDLAKVLKCDIEDIYAYESPCRPLNSLIEESKKDNHLEALAQRHGLVKTRKRRAQNSVAE